MLLSITGMYEYDNSIFVGLDIPTYTDPDNTVHVINKQTVIDNICLKCAELEILYSSISTMKLAIGVWSAANQESWYKLIETQFIKYNPIWNVDADETEKLQHGHTATRTLDYDDTRTVDLTDTERPAVTNTESVKGFNSNSWSESKKIDSSGYSTLERDGTDTLSHDGTDTIAHTGIDTTTKRRTGNIGVTTTQKMINEQREIAEFNIIDYIAESFKNRFCLLIY